MHAEGAAVSAQLGHAGPVAAGDRSSRAWRRRAIFSPLAMRFTARSTERRHRAHHRRLRAARRACSRDGGFDAVELHLGHGYLLSAFLSPKLNQPQRRAGAARVEQPRRASRARSCARCATRSGPAIAVLAKLNMADGVPGGLWLDESVEVARLLEADGALDALELTGGSSLENPMYLFRGEAPIEEMAATFPQPLRTGLQAARRAVPPDVPVRGGVLPALRAAVPRRRSRMPLVLLGGINRLDTVRARRSPTASSSSRWAAPCCASPTCVAAHGSTATPRESLCVHCNKCMPTIYRGTHCVLA